MLLANEPFRTSDSVCLLQERVKEKEREGERQLRKTEKERERTGEESSNE